MANGLEKIAETLRNAAVLSQVTPAQATYPVEPQFAVQQTEFSSFTPNDGNVSNLDPSFLLNYDMSMDVLHLMSFGNDSFGLSPTSHDFRQ